MEIFPNNPNVLTNVYTYGTITAMKSYSIRELDKKLSAALKEIPFLITKHNLPYAQVLPLEKSDVSTQFVNVQTPVKEVKENVQTSAIPDDYKLPVLETLEKMVKEGKCIIPGCLKEGPYYHDLEFWDETIGEMVPNPGFLCDYHSKKINRRSK